MNLLDSFCILNIQVIYTYSRDLIIIELIKFFKIISIIFKIIEIKFKLF